MIVAVNATHMIFKFFIYIMETTPYVSVLKMYAVCKAQVRPYAVSWFGNIKKNAVRKQGKGGGVP